MTSLCSSIAPAAFCTPFVADDCFHVTAAAPLHAPRKDASSAFMFTSPAAVSDGFLTSVTCAPSSFASVSALSVLSEKLPAPATCTAGIFLFFFACAATSFVVPCWAFRVVSAASLVSLFASCCAAAAASFALRSASAVSASRMSAGRCVLASSSPAEKSLVFFALS